MDQKATNILLIFLTVILVFYGGYPIIHGGYPSGGDPFWALAIITFAFLITSIYAMILEPRPQKIDGDQNNREILSIFKPMIRMVLFIGFCGVLLSYSFPNHNTDIVIGILAGVCSGMSMFFFRDFLFQMSIVEKK